MARATWTTDAPLSRYTNVAILLHWTIALLILFNLFTGFFHQSIPRAVWAFHISSGITVLALSLVRIVWRLTHKPPPYSSDMPAWERGVAHVVHFGLYAAMLLLPISGWAMISANPPAGSPGAAYAQSLQPPLPPGASAPRKRGPTMIWGAIKLPLIKPLQDIGAKPEGVPVQKEKHEQIESFHGIGGWLLLGLLALHLAGALKHSLIDGHREFARMGLGKAGRVS